MKTILDKHSYFQVLIMSVQVVWHELFKKTQNNDINKDRINAILKLTISKMFGNPTNERVGKQTKLKCIVWRKKLKKKKKKKSDFYQYLLKIWHTQTCSVHNKYVKEQSLVPENIYFNIPHKLNILDCVLNSLIQCKLVLALF